MLRKALGIEPQRAEALEALALLEQRIKMQEERQSDARAQE
jgi:hypothetical protein